MFWARDADDFADEFVAEHAMKIVVAAEDFDVGVADSGEAHADESPAGAKARQRFLNDGDAASVGDGGKHPANI